jgi:hypothetical protein
MSAQDDIEPSYKTLHLLRKHKNACDRRARLKADWDQALLDEKVVEREVGDWLCPKDAQPMETFHLWVGDGIIEVFYSLETICGQPNERVYHLRWRTPISPTCKVQL